MRRMERAQHLSAPVRLMPRPPTFVVSRKRKTLSLLLKSSTSRIRTATLVEPSILWYLGMLKNLSAGESLHLPFLHHTSSVPHWSLVIEHMHACPKSAQNGHN